MFLAFNDLIEGVVSWTVLENFLEYPSGPVEQTRKQKIFPPIKVFRKTY